MVFFIWLLPKSVEAFFVIRKLYQTYLCSTIRLIRIAIQEMLNINLRQKNNEKRMGYMNLITSDMPRYIQREMERLQEEIAPLLKKMSRYTIWSLPLVFVSIFNLIFIFVNQPIEREAYVVIIFYAIIGAIGLALSKESKLQRKAIHEQITTFMIKRIRKSEISENRKKNFIDLINEQPINVKVNHYINFLTEEQNIGYD
jgi:hypothetical protein